MEVALPRARCISRVSANAVTPRGSWPLGLGISPPTAWLLYPTKGCRSRWPAVPWCFFAR